MATAQTADSDEAFISDDCREAEPSEHDDDGSRGPSALQRQQADALVEISRAYLAGGDGKPSASADHYQVTVHVDEAALRGEPEERRKSDLPIETVRRLCGDGTIVPLVGDETGKPVGVGRKHRVVNPQLRRALLSRDGGCQFPGCTHTKMLQQKFVAWAIIPARVKQEPIAQELEVQGG